MKNVIKWNYERASWQWDVLCILIMVFIFASPKEWFNKVKPFATQNTAEVVISDDCGCEVQ